MINLKFRSFAFATTTFPQELVVKRRRLFRLFRQNDTGLHSHNAIVILSASSPGSAMSRKQGPRWLGGDTTFRVQHAQNTNAHRAPTKEGRLGTRQTRLSCSYFVHTKLFCPKYCSITFYYFNILFQRSLRLDVIRP